MHVEVAHLYALATAFGSLALYRVLVEDPQKEALDRFRLILVTHAPDRSVAAFANQRILAMHTYRWVIHSLRAHQTLKFIFIIFPDLNRFIYSFLYCLLVNLQLNRNSIQISFFFFEISLL
jgi:hypothetical protein